MQIDDLEGEIWVPLFGLETEFLISNCGRAKGVDRIITRKNGRKYPVTGKLRKATKDSHGYYQLCLKKTKTLPLHCAVFFSFNRDIDKKSGFEVDHKDQNKENNRLVNLQYIPCRYNVVKKSINSNRRISSLIGANFHKRTQTWYSRIYENGKYRYLGTFASEIEAHQAYLKANSEVKDLGKPNKKSIAI